MDGEEDKGDSEDATSNGSSSKPVIGPLPKQQQQQVKQPEAAAQAKPEEPGSLPAGFFDDKRKDAEVRKVEVKDEIDEEYAKFKKELQQETVVQAQIDEDVAQEAVMEAELDEEEQQETLANRLELLKRTREFVKQNILKAARDRSSSSSSKPAVKALDDEDEDDGSEGNLVEDIDWRAKQV